VISDVKPNREYEITQSTAVAHAAWKDSTVAPLFADVSAQLGGSTHTEPALTTGIASFCAKRTLAAGQEWRGSISIATDRKI